MATLRSLRDMVSEMEGALSDVECEWDAVDADWGESQRIDGETAFKIQNALVKVRGEVSVLADIIDCQIE